MKRNMFKGAAELEVIVIVGLLLIAVAVAYVHYTAPKPKLPKPAPTVTTAPKMPVATPAAPAVPAPAVPAPAAKPAEAPPLPKITVAPATPATPATPAMVNVNSTAERGEWAPYFLGAFFCLLFVTSLPGLKRLWEFMLLQQPTPALAVAGGGVVKEPEKNVEVQKEKLNNPPADTVVETPPAPQPPPVSTPIPPVDPRSVL